MPSIRKQVTEFYKGALGLSKDVLLFAIEALSSIPADATDQDRRIDRQFKEILLRRALRDKVLGKGPGVLGYFFVGGLDADWYTNYRFSSLPAHLDGLAEACATARDIDHLAEVVDRFASQSWEPATGAGNQRSKSREERNDGKCDHIVLNCASCSASLRLRFPFDAFSFRCPKCSITYSIMRPSQNAEIYCIYPHIDKNRDASRSKTMPSAVVNALEVFGLDESADYESVKKSYRTCIAQYHPDKVAHLGDELKALAAKKTVEYNQAYRTISRFFQEVN